MKCLNELQIRGQAFREDWVGDWKFANLLLRYLLRARSPDTARIKASTYWLDLAPILAKGLATDLQFI